jgi:hypothetical protein
MKTYAGIVRQKKVEEDATFLLIKDGSFFPLLCLTNSALVQSRVCATVFTYIQPSHGQWCLLFNYVYPTLFFST